MKLQNLNIRLLRVPQDKFGLGEFSGNAHPEPDVLRLIEKKGVEHIVNKIKEAVKMSKELRGKNYTEHYGLLPKQKFYDLQERVFFEIEEVIGQDFFSKEKDFTIKLIPTNPYDDFNKPYQVNSNYGYTHTLAYQIIKGGIIDNELAMPRKEGLKKLGAYFKEN